MNESRETIRNIKKEFRLFMNGITSAHLRKTGMQYNIIFGVSIPHLKEIAAKFPKDAGVAHELWKENIRESKLLAILLLPEENYPEVAEKWMLECRYNENADHLAHNILYKLPGATNKALDWIQAQERMVRYCGYQTLSHLFRQGAALTAEQERTFFKQAVADSNAPAMRAASCYCDMDEERYARFNEAQQQA
jgi:hypothetical protein